MVQQEKVDELASVIYSSGMAASLWDAKRKASDILGLTKAQKTSIVQSVPNPAISTVFTEREEPIKEIPAESLKEDAYPAQEETFVAQGDFQEISSLDTMASQEAFDSISGEQDVPVQESGIQEAITDSAVQEDFFAPEIQDISHDAVSENSFDSSIQEGNDSFTPEFKEESQVFEEGNGFPDSAASPEVNQDDSQTQNEFDNPELDSNMKVSEAVEEKKKSNSWDIFS